MVLVEESLSFDKFIKLFQLLLHKIIDQLISFKLFDTGHQQIPNYKTDLHGLKLKAPGPFMLENNFEPLHCLMFPSKMTPYKDNQQLDDN